MITVDVDYDTLADALAQRLRTGQTGSPWLTVKQAAEHLGVSERWLRGRLSVVPHSRVDGRIFLNRNALDTWLQEQSA